MKNLILAAFVALSLGTSGTAFAQGLPPVVGQQQYGAASSVSHANH
jgi:hypothetical protein